MSLTIEPAAFTITVREPADVAFTLRSDKPIGVGDTVEFQFPNSWLLFSGPSFTRELQTSDPEAEHFIEVLAPESDAAFEIEIIPRHLNFPEGNCRHGRHVVATLTEGSVPAGAPIRVRYANTPAPYVAERETLWLRVKSEAPETPPELIVTPGEAESVRILVPSGVEPGESFDVLIVSLDRFDNASATRYEDVTLVRSDGEVVAEGLSFTGTARVPVAINEEGVYRFGMGEVVSSAVRVREGRRGPYWGDIHIHSRISHDAQGADPYGYARDVSGLDFAAVCDHWDSIGPEGYRQKTDWANAAHEPGRFVTIFADERNPREWTGHHNMYFLTEAVFLKHAALDDRRGFLNPHNPDPTPPDAREVMVAPHHTGILFGDFAPGRGGNAVDLDAVDDHGLRPFMEIYSHHGQSENYAPQHALAYEFNRMRNPERRSNTSAPGPHYAQDYWIAGRQLGVIASSDEHSGQGGRRHGGVAVVFADGLTREGVFEAVRLRRSYATTGERILVDFTVDGVELGQEVRRKLGTELPIRLRVWATELLLRVEVLRYRPGVDSRFMTLYSGSPRPESMDADVEVTDTVEGPAVYYARVTQHPIDWPGMAWTSPVWIDV